MDPLPLGDDQPILCLRPKVSRQEALAELSSGPLRRLAAIYIPCRLYRVELRDGERVSEIFLTIDSVRASFDSFSFPAVPAGPELLELRTRNRPAPAVPEVAARAEALERARRLAYERGLLRLRQPRFSAELALPELHLPYWAGFFGRGEEACEVRVLDAVRRRLEGAKLGDFVREWLSGGPGGEIESLPDY